MNMCKLKIQLKILFKWIIKTSSHKIYPFWSLHRFFFLFYLDVIKFCYTTNMNATGVIIITSAYIKLDKKFGLMVLNFWSSPKYLKM